MELISKLIRSLRDDEQGKTWEPERKWLRNQDESEWSLNTIFAKINTVTDRK